MTNSGATTPALRALPVVANELQKIISGENSKPRMQYPALISSISDSGAKRIDPRSTMKSPPKLTQLSVLTLAFGPKSGLSDDFHHGRQRDCRRIPRRPCRPGSLFGGVFHWSFALMQVPVGLALDIFGVRRAVIALSGFAGFGRSR